MHRVIILVSRDEDLLRGRTAAIQNAGISAISASSLRMAIRLVSIRRPQIVVLCQSFEVIEQEMFIDELHETHPDTHVICPRDAPAGQPISLLFACEDCFHAHPGSGKIHILKTPAVRSAVSMQVVNRAAERESA